MYATALPCAGYGLQKTPQANNPALDGDASGVVGGVMLLYVAVFIILFVFFSFFFFSISGDSELF